jgi:hypothetical protein
VDDAREDTWLTIGTLSYELRRSPQWIRMMIARGRLQSTRDSSGRRLVLRSELDRFVKAQHQHNAAPRARR